jgi:hypothetical protein
MQKIFLNGTIIIAIVISFGITTLAQTRPLLGGYKPAETDDAEVVAAAEFAVEARAEKNPEQEGLTLDSVDKAEKQVVAGTNYRLCLTVSLEDESQQVKVVVYQKTNKEYSLTSWTPEDCSGSSSNKTDDSMRQTSGSLPIKRLSVANCSGEQLALSEGEGDADIGGKRYGRYIFTNISLKPCKLSGFPRFSLLNKAGKVMRGVAVKYNNDFPGGEIDSETKGAKPSPIRLDPKQTALFQVYYNDGMALDIKRPVPTSAKVNVKAPNTTREFIIKSKIQACCGVQVSSIRGDLP